MTAHCRQLADLGSYISWQQSCDSLTPRSDAFAHRPDREPGATMTLSCLPPIYLLMMPLLGLISLHLWKPNVIKITNIK